MVYDIKQNKAFLGDAVLRFRLACLFVLVLFCCFVDASGNSNLNGTCVIKHVSWMSEPTEYDEAQMQSALGIPCSAWGEARDKLISYYENHGFIGAKLTGFIKADTLVLNLDRGRGWVWANAENLDSNGTKIDVFRKLTGIEAGEPVSLEDLKRSERKLLRIGYYEQTAPARLFRDPNRNRIIPAFSMRKANVSEAEGFLTYSSEDNVWEGAVNVDLYNIMGTARDLHLDGFVGESSRHLDGGYKEPWFLGTKWNVLLRGRFDENTYEEDFAVESFAEDDTSESETVERVVVGEIGVSRDIGFDFNVAVYLGFGEDETHSSLEMSYESLDRFALPRNGWRIKGAISWKMERLDSLDDFLNASAGIASYYPLYKNFIARFSGSAGGIFPSDAEIPRMELFELGGPENFRGMSCNFVRTTAFGFSELALLWQDGYDLSIEAFYQPGLYRKRSPWHGWAREQNYGIGLTQYRSNWSISLYYALRNGCNYLDGILGFGVKTLF